MTDLELIRLIEERTPGEWTPAELAELKQRSTASPEVRQALAARLEIDGQLAAGLGEIDITVETIKRRAERSATLARRRKLAAILGPLGFVGLLIAVGFWFRAPANDPADQLANDDSVAAVQTTSDENSSDTDPSADAVSALAAIPEVPIAEIVATKPLPPMPKPVQPEPEPEPVGPLEPWTAAYAAKAVVWKPDDNRLRLDFVSAGHDDFPEEEARRWWKEIAGQPFNWGQDAVGGKRIARFQGLAQLRMPWRADTLLRMTLLDSTACELFFWRGKEGVSLRYYAAKEPHVWAAYRISRDDSASPAAKRTSLLTTDSGAFFRSTPGTFDVQVRGENLLLARGGITLMTVPLGGIPQEVMLEGQCRFRGMSVHRSEPLSLPAPDGHRLVQGGDNPPATWKWEQTGTLPALSAEPLPDGRMTFRWDSRDQIGSLHASLPQPGIYEAIFQVESAEPGTGIFVGDAAGKPFAKLAIQRDQKSQQLVWALVPASDAKDTLDQDVAQAPAPYLGPGQWVKLVAGLGTVRAWVSGDRVHWGHLAQLAAPESTGSSASFGISALPGPAARSLTLSRLDVRELSGLTNLADAGLLPQTPAFAPEELADEAMWMHRALAALPPGSDATHWLDACAVRALQQGAKREFSLVLINRLLDGACRPEADVARALAAIRDTAILQDTWEEARVIPLANRLHSVGLQQLDAGAQRPSQQIRTAWLQLPISTISPVKAPFSRLARNELIAAVSRNETKTAAALAAEIQFWNHPSLPGAPLVEAAQSLDKLTVWVRAMTADQQPAVAGTSDALPLAYRHPLVQQFNKEGYNLRAELDAALTSQAYDDACRLVTSLGSEVVDGLLPDLNDRQLFVSMPTAVLTALREHPDFGTAMNRSQGAAGLVKVRQAMADGLIDVVRAATVQYLGTPAAAEAHRWLGDRHLASGKYADAEAHYRFAIDSASLEQKSELKPRLFLAEAWSGKPARENVEQLLAGDIELNGRKITPAEFATLLADARTTHGPILAAATAIAVSPPPPAGYKLQPRGQFDGHSGANPGKNDYRFGDPFGKQLAYAVDDQFVYLSNRFQTNAYDPTTGQVKWSQGVGSEQGEAHDFAFQQMRPVVHRDVIFVRRLTRAGAELCCLKKTDGTVVWKQRPMTHVLTDPVVWQGELCALVGGKVEEEQLQVDFAKFDFQTGNVLSTKTVAKFRDVWNQAIPCTWSVGERWAACQIGNVTASLTPDGVVRWLRKPSWLPGPIDDLATDFRAAEPLVAEDRLVLAAPGSRSVDCIDLATGRLTWRTALPEVRGLRGQSAQRIVVDLGDGLCGLDPANGEVVWRTTLGTLLEAFTMDDRLIVCARRGRAISSQHRPNLAWLDLLTGVELSQTQLETNDKEDWQLGPIVPVQGKLWFLGGTGFKDHKREFLELSAVTATAPAPFVDRALGHWAPDLIDSDRHAFASILPAWMPPVDYKSRWQFVPTDVRGETRLMISRTGENQQPTWLTSRIDIPVEPSSLHFRVANQPGQKWRLVVRIENEVVLDQVLDDAATSNNWQDVAVDLTRFAGRSAFATAMHGPVDGQPSEALWKSIELLKN